MATEHGGILASNPIKGMLYHLIRKDLHKRAESQNINLTTRDAAIHSVVAAAFGLLSWWLD